MISLQHIRCAALALAIVSLGAAGLAQDQAQSTPPPAGGLVLSPSAFGGESCYQGWPLVLELTLWRELPADANGPALEPLNIIAQQGTWRDALVVTVKNDEGGAVQWPLRLVAREGGQLTLANAPETVEWWLSPEETKALAEGHYTITVAFDPQKVGGLPTAPAPRSDACQLHLAKEPAQLDADLAAAKLYRQAWYCIVKGDTAGADGAIGQLLAADPKSIGARRLKAMLAAREGRVEEGLALVNEAIAIYLTKHPHACPPIGLLDLQERLQGELTQ